MEPNPPIRWQWPQLRLRPALLLLGVFTVIGVMNFNAVLLAMRMEGSTTHWSRPFVWELTGAMGPYLCLPIILAALLNAPRPDGRWARFLGIHLGAFVLYALLVPCIFFVSRTLIYAALGWGSYSFGPLRLQLPMEWQKQVMAYATISIALALVGHMKDSRAKALRESELQAKLQEARLQALSAQLDPHFLFNALNTVSAMMYQDLKRTDRLLASLGQMLRDGLESGAPFWPLSRELDHLEAFLDFALARFEQLRVERHIEPGLGELPVPRFGLQRLVENVLKHNQERAGQPLFVRITARREEGFAVLEVFDDGRGFEDPARVMEGNGIGLRNLQDSLALRFGPEAAFQAMNGPQGGALAQIRIPLESLP